MRVRCGFVSQAAPSLLRLGNWSQTRACSNIRVRVKSEDGSTQQDSLTGDFARNSERELSVSARPNGLSLVWQATNASGPSSGSGWFARYAGALCLTIGGSIISAITGFALRELPAHIRARQSDEPKVQSTAAGHESELIERVNRQS